jgi:hypothetical protein
VPGDEQRRRSQLFFFEARTGTLLGTMLHPRPQTSLENCTWHNYNVVPTDKRHVIVSGNYQSGISVVDFTDPANATEIAYADPATLVDPNPRSGSSSAAIGPPTGTTASSTSPTSREAYSPGTSGTT